MPTLSEKLSQRDPRWILAEGHSFTLTRSKNFTAADVFNTAKDSDELSIDIFATAGYYLGIALAGLINVLNPEVIFITGGLSGAVRNVHWPNA